MMKLVSHLLFMMTGWKQVGKIPEGVRKSVMIAAPHTSNWDLIYARAAFFIMKLPIRVTIKKELFFFPLGLLLKWLGAIPIDRTRKKTGLDKKNSVVQQMVDYFKTEDHMVVMITPEGTRKYAPRWKTGFYHVALEANVPIVLGYLDYAKKHAGVGPTITPTGNIEEDMATIMDFYRGITPKFPENGVR